MAQTKSSDISEKPPGKGGVWSAVCGFPRRVLHGDVVRSDFIIRHSAQIIVLLVLVMSYISTKYQNQTAMERVRKLEKELEVVRTEAVRNRAAYMSRIRQASMTALADSVCPGLSANVQPPYVLDTYSTAAAADN